MKKQYDKPCKFCGKVSVTHKQGRKQKAGSYTIERCCTCAQRNK